MKEWLLFDCYKNVISRLLKYMKLHCDRQSLMTCTVERKQLEPVNMLRCKGISQSITLYAANVCLADRYASKLKCEVLLQKIQESMSL